jgi:carnitine-CoA ligase
MAHPEAPRTAPGPAVVHPPGATVSALFQAALRRAPDRRFLAMEHGSLTYAQAADWSGAVAGALAARGIARGDCVAMVSTNRLEMIVLWLACLRLGACFCPLNPGFTAGQLANLFRRMAPSLIVAEPAMAPASADAMARSERPVPTIALGPAPAGWSDWRELERAVGDPGWAGASAGDLAAILCTSGTTGASKAVALSHRWFTKISETTARYWRFSARDVFYSPFPLYHIDARPSR